MTVALAIRGLTKAYAPGTPVLAGIDLDIGASGVTAIIGPSGTGKSTLIRCINRLVEPSAGTIALFGEELTALRGSALRLARRRIGMVFQEFNLVERLTVIENLLCGRLGYVSALRAWLRRFPQEDIEHAFDLLEAVGLEAFARVRADALSGGQRQRVGIARALMQQPQLLLADEPTSSLDPKTSVEIMALVRDLAAERGIPVIVNMHDVGLARRFAERVIGLSGGRVVYDGPPAGLGEAHLKRIYGGEELARGIRRRGGLRMMPRREARAAWGQARAGGPPLNEGAGRARAARTRRAFAPDWAARAGWLLLLVYCVYAASLLDLSAQRVVEGLGHAEKFLDRMFPPNFSKWDVVVRGLKESLEIAVLASAGGIALALPLGFLAARNLMPAWISWPARAVIAACRTFHPVIVAIVFVKAVGFGALAGVLALVVASIGFAGKLFAEAIEEISARQVEAVRATGASFMNVVLFGVLPQVFPRFVGFSTYQFDANVRNSTLVGIVGAGGIGAPLFVAFQRFDYDVMCAILIAIIAVVFACEILSNLVKRVFGDERVAAGG